MKTSILKIYALIEPLEIGFKRSFPFQLQEKNN